MKKYIEIYENIRNKINSGELKEGEKLPSVRKAADIYNVSITTIQNAYFDLSADGYIASVDKSGYFVTKKQSDATDFKTEAKNNSFVYDFTGGIADPESFDINLWQRYIKSALRQEERMLSYSDAGGEYDLRCELSGYIYKKRNIIAPAERIIVGAGVQPLLHILCSILKGKKTVSFPDSSFYQGINTFKDYGYEVHTRDKDAEIIYVSPSHMTSWGDVMPTKRRLELVDYSLSHGSLVIEDDYENEFLYNKKPTPSLFALGKGNIVYIGSFSAMLLPGIRISFMVLTKELSETFRKERYRFSQTAGITEQVALCNFIRDGHIYSQTNKIRRLYTAKAKHFCYLLASQSKNCEITVSENQLQVIIKTKKAVSADDFFKENINVFCADDHTVVLSPAGVSSEKFNDAAKVILSTIA